MKSKLPHNPTGHSFCETCSPDNPKVIFKVIHNYDFSNMQRGKHRQLITGFEHDFDGFIQDVNGDIRDSRTGDIVTPEETGFELIGLETKPQLIAPQNKDAVYCLEAWEKSKKHLRSIIAKHRPDLLDERIKTK